MKCGKCNNSRIVAWPWDLGGYRGYICWQCNSAVYSKTIQELLEPFRHMSANDIALILLQLPSISDGMHYINGNLVPFVFTSTERTVN